jgi:hypothetical protein
MLKVPQPWSYLSFEPKSLKKVENINFTKITLNHNKNIPITTKHLITTKNVHQQGGKNIPAYITNSRGVLVETSNERKILQ